MCTRYTIASSVPALENELQAEFQYSFSKIYNAHFGLELPIILSDEENRIVAHKWGLVPYWAKEPKARFYRINSPARDIVKNPASRVSVRNKRCLVLANCFFVWIRAIDGNKVPHVVYDGRQRIMTFAGIWDEWINMIDQTKLRTFSIVTTHSNKRLKGYTRQMPVIIPPGRRRKYLRTSTHLNEVMRMLRPLESETMNLYEVSSLVNAFDNNSREVIQPTGERVYKEYTYVPRVYLKLEGMGSMKDNPDRKPEIKLMI